MDGIGLAATVPLIIHVLDINDETPIFQDTPIQFILTQDMRNFTERAVVKVNVFFCYNWKSVEDIGVHIYTSISGQHKIKHSLIF